MSTKRFGVLSCVAAALVATGGLSSAAEAAQITTFNFGNITNNGPVNIASQFSVDVSDTTHGGTLLASDRVAFIFRNNGPVSSAISQVYFEDGELLGIASVNTYGMSSFSQGGSPSNLPGGGGLSPSFQATTGFLAAQGAGNPLVEGVAVGELVEIVFDLQPNKDYDDVIAAIHQGMLDPTAGPSIRIGIHVQAIDDGLGEDFSDSFVVVIPLPPAAWMGLAGLGGVLLVSRKRLVK